MRWARDLLARRLSHEEDVSLMSAAQFLLITTSLLLLGCKEPPEPPPRPLYPPVEEESAEVIAAREAKVADLLKGSRCAKDENWSREVGELKAGYIDGRYGESILAAQRADERCHERALVQHIAHCYELLGMKHKAKEALRDAKKRENKARRIDVKNLGASAK
jgi:hypothetical protein